MPACWAFGGWIGRFVILYRDIHMYIVLYIYIHSKTYIKFSGPWAPSLQHFLLFDGVVEEVCWRALG